MAAKRAAKKAGWAAFISVEELDEGVGKGGLFTGEEARREMAVELGWVKSVERVAAFEGQRCVAQVQ
jgi:hypothetical protein